MQQQILQWIASEISLDSVISLLTLAVLAWTLWWLRRYTLAAEKQVGASLEQVEALQRPLLTIDWVPLQGRDLAIRMIGPGSQAPIVIGTVPDYGIKIKNIGSGPALNVLYALRDMSTGKEVPAFSGRIPHFDKNEPFQTHISLSDLHNHELSEIALAYESLGSLKYETKVSITRRWNFKGAAEHAIIGKQTTRL